MVLTEVLNRLKDIEIDIMQKILEFTGERQKEAKLDLEALSFAIELVQEAKENV